MSQTKILIIDDEEGIRESLKLILSDWYDLILVKDGEQALDCLKKTPEISLILMDIKMPRINGLEVLKIIQSQFKHIPTVIISGYNSVETATAAVELGARGYLVKPFKSADILATVKNILTPTTPALDNHPLPPKRTNPITRKQNKK